MKSVIFFACTVLSAAALDYKKDVMPILKEKCYDCHSDKAKKVKGGLRFDDEEHFFKRFAKNDVVIPGDWDASYLFVTVVWPEHKKGAMPPKNKGERLTEKEIRTVAQWIHEGAKIDGEKERGGQMNSILKRFSSFRMAVSSPSSSAQLRRSSSLSGKNGQMPKVSLSLRASAASRKGRPHSS